MFSKSRSSSSDSSGELMVTPNASLPRSCQLVVSPGYFANEPEIGNDRPQDSLTKRRRHACYYPRPPVWRFGHCPHRSKDVPDVDDDDEDEHIDSPLHTKDECEECKLSLAKVVNPDFRWLSENIFQDGLQPTSFHQSKAPLCTRLQFCKDIRVRIDESWAIEEGSLVVSIDPEYTNVDSENRAADEFELAYGEVYVVCRLYADFWALCVKISFAPVVENCHERVAFLPVCAVTLAANFNAFINRCSSYIGTSRNELKYPGNGLSVTPPERCHSLNASKQIFQGNSPNVEIPAIAHEACDVSFLGKDLDFIPLDSTLEHLLSEIGGNRGPLGKHLSFKKIWREKRASDSEFSDDSRMSPQKQLSDQSYRDEERRHSCRNRSSLSSASGGLKWFKRSPRGETGRHRRNIREIISSSSERLKSHSRGNSTESESLWR